MVYHSWVSWVWFSCGNSLQHGLWVFCSHFSLAHYWPRTNFYAYFLGWEFANCSLNLYSKFPEERYQVQMLQEAFSFPLLKPEIDKWVELLGNFFSALFSCDHSSFQGLILGRISSLGAGLLGFASCSRCELTSTPLLPLAHCYSIPSSALCCPSVPGAAAHLDSSAYFWFCCCFVSGTRLIPPLYCRFKCVLKISYLIFLGACSRNVWMCTSSFFLFFSIYFY